MRIEKLWSKRSAKMKVPKLFRTEIDLEGYMARWLKKQSCNHETVSYLLDGCETFKREITQLSIDCETFLREIKPFHRDDFKVEKEAAFYLGMYKIGEGMSKETSYTKYELEEMSKRIIVKEKRDEYLGLYLSALANKVIKDYKPLVLAPEAKLLGVGAYQKTGTVLVEGSTGRHTGFCMAGGKLIVTGDAGKLIGEKSGGGLIVVYGEISSVGKNCEGMVCQKEKGVLLNHSALKKYLLIKLK